MTFAFRELELDAARFELRRRGAPVAIQPKVLELLLHLVRHRDRVVSKAELLLTVWPGTRVTDSSLLRAVSLARRAIGDRDPNGALATVPRRGYRFQAPVREIPAAVEGATDDAPRYVGRTSLLEAATRVLDAALGGGGRVLWLAGEAGIGKTRTAQLLMEHARRRGAIAAAAWGLRAQPSTYRAWTCILNTLASYAPSAAAALAPATRARLAPIAEAIAGDGERPDAPVPEPLSDAGRLRLFEAVCAFVAGVAREAPIALCLDDLHDADAESLALLEFVAQSIDALPVAIVATCREDDAGRTPSSARTLERLLRLPALERWRLTGLSGEEIQAFARARLAREPSPELVEALVRQTDGNPLLLRESLRALEAHGLLATERTAAAWEALIPRGIQHLLRPVLRQLEPAAVETLACAVAIGDEPDRELLARCVGDARGLDARLRALCAVGLLLPGSAAGSTLRFSHAVVRDALERELLPPGTGRRSVHARISDALEAAPDLRDDALAARAHHALEAAPLVDPERALGLARDAASRAGRLRDFERAAGWHRRAVELLERTEDAEPARVAALYLALGEAERRAHGIRAARDSYRRAADWARAASRDDLFAAAALGFAHRPSAIGRGDPEVIGRLEEALGELGRSHEALRLRLVSRLAVELRYADRARARALVEEILPAARRLGDASVLAQVLDDATYVLWSPDDTRGWIALNAEVAKTARAAGDPELEFDGRTGCVTGALELGDRPALERALRASDRSGEALRTPYARWLGSAFEGMRALLAGDLAVGEEAVARSLRLAERVDSVEVALQQQVQLVYLRIEQGRAGEVEASVRAQVERFPEAPAWRASIARLLVATGRTDEARAELARVARSRFADVPRDRGWIVTLALAAEVACAVGATRVAALTEKALGPYAHLSVVAGSGILYYGPVSHHLGLAAIARAEWDTAVERLERALAAERRAGARLWEARTRIALARALEGRGRPADRARARALAGAAAAEARPNGWEDVVRAGAALAALVDSMANAPV